MHLLVTVGQLQGDRVPITNCFDTVRTEILSREPTVRTHSGDVPGVDIDAIADIVLRGSLPVNVSIILYLILSLTKVLLYKLNNVCYAVNGALGFLTKELLSSCPGGGNRGVGLYAYAREIALRGES